MIPKYFDVFTRPVHIDPTSTALVIVDLQYASGSRQYGFGALLEKQGKIETAKYRFDRIENLVVPNSRKLLEAFRQMGGRIIFITLGCELPDYSDAPAHMKAFFVALNNTSGNREHEILDELKPLRGELIINKVTQGAFASSGIDAALRALQIKTLVITGVSTNNCVETTAREASDRGFGVILVSDATGTDCEEMQELTLRGFSRLWGRVASTDEVIGELNNIRSIESLGQDSEK
jgi:biuret amidohydrolase